MSRGIPFYLAAHLQGAATTVCYLLLVKPVRAPSTAFGITTLDRDVTYDDGNGPIVYRARRGYTATDFVADAALGVDNGEAAGLLAEYPFDGMTLDGIRRGDYDSAQAVQYLVNYLDTSLGHVEINSGTVGRVRVSDELSISIELRSFTQTLKQLSIIELTSVSCRARFGDARCKVPLVWTNATVASVGPENDRTFTVSAIPAGFKVPGIVSWKTGENAGREYEIEDYDSGSGLLTLLVPTYFPVKVGDALQIRRDCDKSRSMCRDSYGNMPNFRGEPDLPLGVGNSIQTPGVQV